jgi:NADH-quinone oxidoreductase subunit D
MREMRESHKIVQQAVSRLKPGPVKADAPKVVLPDREAMKTHMDALIHHFLLVAEGVDVPPGEVYHPIEASKGELASTLNLRVGQNLRACIFAGRAL